MSRMTWKLLRFLLAPLVDDWSGLSLTRFLAIGCFTLAAYGATHGGGITANVVWLLTLAIAAAFGKATFMAIASRGSWSATVNESTVRQITERRNNADHPDTEPTP